MGRTLYIKLNKIDNSKLTIPELAQLLRPVNGKGQFFPLYYPNFHAFPNMGTSKVWKELERKLRNKKKDILEKDKTIDKYDALVHAILQCEKDKLIYFDESYMNKNEISNFIKPGSNEDVEGEMNKYCLLAIMACKNIENFQCELREDDDVVPICPIIIQNKGNKNLVLKLNIEEMIIDINYWKKENYLSYANKFEHLVNLYGDKEYEVTSDILLSLGIKDDKEIYKKYKNNINNISIVSNDLEL